MEKLKNAMLNRRQALALGLGTTVALGLAACSNDGDAAPGGGGSSSESAPKVDTAAFDKLVASGPKAEDATIAQSTWASKVKSAGVLRVGAVDTSALFCQHDEKDDTHRGFDAGLFKLLANYILGDPMSYKRELVTSQTRESVLQNDVVDAVFATYSINDERKKLISFAGPYFVARQGILVKADNDSIKSPEDLKDKIVGVQKGSNGREYVEPYGPKEVQELATDGEIRRLLEQGRIDAYVVDSTLLKSDMVENPGKYTLAAEFGDPDPYGIGLPHGSDGVAFVNGFLKKIEDEGLWTDLYKLFFGDEGADNPPAIES